MNKKYIIYLIVTICIACFYNNLYGIKATSKIIKIKQPDGTFVSLRIKGDERGAYYLTPDGISVVKNSDGFFRVSTSSGFRAAGVSDRLFNAGEAVAGFSFVNRSNASVQEIRSLVLLVQFSDIKFSTVSVKERISEMLNSKGYSYNGATGSAADYFNDNFNGKAVFTFDVSDIITLPNNEKVYGAQTETDNDSNPSKMIADACVEAQKMGVDFSKYDLNSDGKVDNVFVIYAGYNQAEGGDPDTVWPHYGDISSMKINCNGVTLGFYGCASELKDNSGAILSPIGTFCHEFSHSLGLVDMYDTNYDTEGLSTGMYSSLSIMDAGNYLNDGNTPPCFTSIEREILGLSTVEYLAADKCYVINPVNNESSIFRLNTSNAGEYFLFECRAKSGWDKYIGGEGLVVYHVDKSNIVYGGIESSKRWLYNNVNAYAMHECAKVFPSGGADTKLVCDLFYPGTFGITSISASGEPAFVDWNSKTTGISISGITFKNNTITLNTNGEYALDPSLPKVKNVAFSPYQYDCRLSWIPTTSSTSCKWRIIWKEKSAREYPDTNLLVTEEYSVLIHDLVPGKDYIIQIESLQGNFVGETYKDIFKTLAVTSRFPYMNLTGSYKVGDLIDLKILNLKESYASIRWLINGQESQAYVKLEKSGVYKIEAEIIYADKSAEIFRKIINVR